ncbi:SWIM zinc finger family protein [Streptomyces sp. H10-C2]|uniref:SWIM zinc finger family protein n=1 Tax=unclassified Streptomyces TaxID=2593676 RepID=UPI0024B8ED4D|nr:MULTISPECIES: SWIM zinc finger family protein [unclassified Streptomyces]MDJ0342618.1 SWIM zinc finger family protein [Streptomyces sp. PH10-H1]MDJ0368528.1 SWIM zinc finger family protein [Streptomyces sp. H10-C2]
MTRRTKPQRELTRTFEALPPAKGSRAPFAESWWGREWLCALEDSSLDTGRLQRGRTYARRGAVGRVVVAPGSAAAPVQGSRPTPYRSKIQVEQLTDQQWDRLLDMIAERAANIAALLDGDMPAGLADDAAAAGVPLLPGPRDLDPACNCPDWGYPCKHAAALCYQVARLLDRDPFVLLLLRGRGERDLMDELGRRNTARAAAEAASYASAPDPAVPPPPRTGDPAGPAFASRTALPPVPAPPPLPERPGRGPALVDAATPAPGLDPAALELLAADAATRAHHLLAAALGARHADTAPPASLTEWQDAVRLVVAHPTMDVFAGIASNCGRTPAELAAATRAWRHGGAASLDVLENPWNPSTARLERDRQALRADWTDGRPPRLRSWRNRWTVEGRDAQLRLGRDGLWYPYTKDQDTWWPAGPPDADPAVVLTALLET